MLNAVDNNLVFQSSLQVNAVQDPIVWKQDKFLHCTINRK